MKRCAFEHLTFTR